MPFQRSTSGMLQHFSRRYLFMAITGAFFSLLLLDVLINETDGAYSTKALHNVHAALAAHDPICEPYDAFGTLNVDLRDPHANRWIPFDRSCHAPALVASLTRAVWGETPENQLPAASPIRKLVGSSYIHEPLAPDGKEWEDMEWLRGRTVLYVGDSVARHTAFELCDILKGQQPKPIGPGSEFYPWEEGEATRVGDKIGLLPPGPESGFFKPDGVNGKIIAQRAVLEERKASAYEHGPFYCHVPELDFIYVTVFSFGLDEYGFFADNEQDVAGPYEIEQRLEEVAKPIIDRVQEQLGRPNRKPDVVMLMSALWDNTRWMSEDLQAGVEPHAFISDERITWYSDKIASTLNKAIDLFPSTPIRWVTNHFPIPHETRRGKFNRPAHLLPRLWRMSQASHAAVQVVSKEASRKGTDVRTLNWGEKIMGSEAFQHDDLHPRLLPSNYVFLDMMLYDLRRSLR